MRLVREERDRQEALAGVMSFMFVFQRITYTCPCVIVPLFPMPLPGLARRYHRRRVFFRLSNLLKFPPCLAEIAGGNGGETMGEEGADLGMAVTRLVMGHGPDQPISVAHAFAALKASFPDLSMRETEVLLINTADVYGRTVLFDAKDGGTDSPPSD